MTPRLTFITLGVADLDVAVAFYESGLRLSLQRRSRDYAFFDLAGVTLALYRRELLLRDGGLVSDPGVSFCDVLLSLNLESRAAVDEWMRAATRCGGSVTRAAAASDWGGYAGFIADPDQHVWELVWNPKLNQPA